MREIRTSGLMSGEGKRVVQAIPRLSSTLLPSLFLRAEKTCLLAEVAKYHTVGVANSDQRSQQGAVRRVCFVAADGGAGISAWNLA